MTGAYSIFTPRLCVFVCAACFASTAIGNEDSDNMIASGLACDSTQLTTTGQCSLSSGPVSFQLLATDAGSLNTLTLTSFGLEHDTGPYSIELDGSAYGAQLADLDGNGWPEVYVYVSSAGSGSYGSLVAYAVNNGKSATPIYLPPLNVDALEHAGYQGHDVFHVAESRLIRRYPIYLDGDTNAKASGGTRQVEYRLTAGEAGWVLAVDRITED
jgi:hypothetical protein